MNLYRTEAFLATEDSARSRSFYVDRLGAELLEETSYSLVLRCGSTQLRLQKVQSAAPPPYTALGWEVDDLEAEVLLLARRGVALEQFEGIDRDQSGIWTAPDGSGVAWLRDPDGQLLSLAQSC